LTDYRNKKEGVGQVFSIRLC